MNKINTFSYIAGYFDGDGCFYIGNYFEKTRNKIKYQSRIIISSTNTGIINIVKKYFKVSVSKNKIRQGHEDWKTQYMISIRKESKKLFIDSISAFLVEKQKEAEIIKQFINTKDKHVRERLIKEIKIQKNEVNLIDKSSKELIHNIATTQKVNDVESAYMAGFIDAECCFSISKYKSKNGNMIYKPFFKLNDTKLPVFKWIKERFGGRVIFINRKDKNIKHKNQLSMNIICNNLKFLINKIYPFIEQKKKICTHIISFNETILKNGGDRNSEEFRKSYSETFRKREIIANEIHKLNLKGKKTI